MSISLGSTNFGSLYLGATKIGEAYLGSVKVYGSTPVVDPFNPLGLPSHTMRLRFSDGVTPTFQYGGSAVQVSSGTGANIWDYTYYNYSWESVFYGQTDLLEILGGNTTGITDMVYMCRDCTSLTSVALFDTRNMGRYNGFSGVFSGCSSLVTVPTWDLTGSYRIPELYEYCPSLTSASFVNTGTLENVVELFLGCSSLTVLPSMDTSHVTDFYAFARGTAITAIPLIDTSSAINVSEMFFNTQQATSGALAMYQQMAAQSSIQYHNAVFAYCGDPDVSQIPSDWKTPT